MFHRTLRKNWGFAYGTSPDVIVFLGDMLAHGHHLDDDEEYVSVLLCCTSLMFTPFVLGISNTYRSSTTSYP